MISPLNIDLLGTLIMMLFGQIGTVKGCKIIHMVMSESKPCPQLFDCTCGKWEAQALRQH